MLSQRFTFFSAMLGFLIINALSPATVVGTPIILSIIWAGAGLRYTFYGVLIWTVLDIPSFVFQTNVQEGLLTTAFNYVQNQLISQAQAIGTPQAEKALSYASSQLADVTWLIMWWPFEFTLLLVSVPLMFLLIARILRIKWSRRLAHLSLKVKPY